MSVSDSDSDSGSDSESVSDAVSVFPVGSAGCDSPDSLFVSDASCGTVSLLVSGDVSELPAGAVSGVCLCPSVAVSDVPAVPVGLSVCFCSAAALPAVFAAGAEAGCSDSDPGAEFVSVVVSLCASAACKLNNPAGEQAVSEAVKSNAVTFLRTTFLFFIRSFPSFKLFVAVFFIYACIR